jgi:acyl-CoA synthetase (NDP forming)
MGLPLMGLQKLGDDTAAAAALLAPESLVVVGASERSRWAVAMLDNLDRLGFPGPVHLVNRSGNAVGSRTTATSCAALGEKADLGVILVPADGAVDALTDLAETGARSAIVLTSGFAETGAGGAGLQARLLTAAQQAGIRLLGPNSLGMMNFVDRAVAWATPISAPSTSQGVALVSQSGATAFFLATMADQQDLALSYVVSTGNEADLDSCTFACALAADPNTRAIAMFLESVRRPDRFVAAAEAANAAGKPLVVLKVGTSEVAARSALAHTGALTGDDAVFTGVCERYGVLRVRSLEELMATADIVGRTGRLRSGGLAVVSNSGGICEVAADTADVVGIDLPEVPAATVETLRSALPAYGTPHNPLDLTGGIVPADVERIVTALGAAPEYAAVLVPFYPVPAGDPAEDARLAELHGHLAAALRTAPAGFLVSYTPATLTARGRRTVAEVGIPYLACGMDRALTGLASAVRWSRHPARDEPVASDQLWAIGHTSSDATISERPRTEFATLELLSRHGVPVVPSVLVTDEAGARAAAGTGPVAVKICSPDIAHKTEIGGVELGVVGPDAAAAAFARVLAAGRSVTGAQLDGVVVAPMRDRGLELFVGVTRDPAWGPVIAVGLGGIWVEVLRDVAIRPLPVTPAVVKDMLAGLQGAKLLAGARGLPAADTDAVAAAVVAIGEFALRCGPDLAELDVNPLWVQGDRIEALDALAVWA